MKKILFIITMLALTATSFAAVEGKLSDVTAGKEIRGITTPNNATGHATVSYTTGDFDLNTSFKNLTDPQGDDFYEGWLVRQSPFAFISTGKAEKVNGYYENDFDSVTDYREYDFYILTLEPNDGNDDPADHILEGNVLAIKAGSTQEKKELIVDSSLNDKSMMKKEVSTYQKTLRTVVKNRIIKIGASKLNGAKILERITQLRTEINNKGYSQKKIEQYREVLDAVEYVLMEIN